MFAVCGKAVARGVLVVGVSYSNVCSGITEIELVKVQTQNGVTAVQRGVLYLVFI